MKKRKGSGLSPGVVIGKTMLLIPSTLDIEPRKITGDQVNSEIERFRHDASACATELSELLIRMASSGPEKDILEAQKMILQDPDLEKEIGTLIREREISAENAAHEVFGKLVDFFQNTQDDIFSQRAVDYREVGLRLVRRLSGHEDDYPLQLEPDSVLVMEEIPAVLVMRYAGKGLVGLVAERGSQTGHSAIIARAMGVPFVAGLPEVMQHLTSGMTVALDGDTGECVFAPDDATVSLYRQLKDQAEQRDIDLARLSNLETRTKDGIQVHLRCNIGFPGEIEQVLKVNSEGIGLFRTEFLFMDRSKPPDEDEQYEIYSRIAQKAGKQEVIIRTIDVGGDKFANMLKMEREENPNLGARGIRISLKYQEIFRIQLKAILRAARFGKVAMMFPMVSSLEEVRRAKRLISECKLELKNKSIPFEANVPTGIMIEVPSAALISDALAAEVDFFSIGTNDLVQYVLAVDRNSENVPEYYTPYHPAVLQLITMVAQSGRKHSIPVSVCGEMAADRDFIPFLVGLGISELSVAPRSFLATKEWIMQLQTQSLVDLVLTLLEKTTIQEVRETIRAWRKNHGLTV